MYYITRKQWEKIPDAYKMEHSFDNGAKCCFLCFLTPDGTGGTTLCFEHKHFEVVEDLEA